MHKNKGFTLIEVLVVIGVIGILSLIILINFHGYNKSNQLREAAQQVRSAIVEAQNMALAPKDEGNNWYYGIRFNRDPAPTVEPPANLDENGNVKVYTLKKYQYITGSSSDNTSEIKSFNLPQGVKWSTNNTWQTAYIFFKPPNAVTYQLLRTGPNNPDCGCPSLEPQPASNSYNFILTNDTGEEVTVSFNYLTGQTNVH